MPSNGFSPAGYPHQVRDKGTETNRCYTFSRTITRRATPARRGKRVRILNLESRPRRKLCGAGAEMQACPNSLSLELSSRPKKKNHSPNPQMLRRTHPPGESR